MNEVIAFALSPTGIALYAGFWALKLLFGAWALRQIVMRLPEQVQGWIEDKLARLRFRRARQE